MANTLRETRVRSDVSEEGNLPRSDEQPKHYNFNYIAGQGGYTFPRLLLLDSDSRHAEELAASLRANGCAVTSCADIRTALRALTSSIFEVNLVVSVRLGDWKKPVAEIRDGGPAPRILCLARSYRGPVERLEAERLGVRFVYSDNAKWLWQEIDFLLAEQRELSLHGPTFRIVHRFRMPGSDCLPGEEIFAVVFLYRGREYFLRLPLGIRIFFDYMAHHPRVPQSAGQIAGGVCSDEFYRQHAANGTGRSMTRRITRSYVRVYADRLRIAMAKAFEEAQVHIDPRTVLVELETVGNERGYQLKAKFEWQHVDLTAHDVQPLW